MALAWTDDPRLLELDARWRAELDVCLDVLRGARKWRRADYADERLCAVAALGESFRQSGAAPTPLRLATMLRRLGLGDRGALRWISRLQFGDLVQETGS